MCHYIWGVRSREDRGSKADNAVHRQRLWRKRLVNSANQEHGAGDESSTRIVRKRQNVEEQQFFEVWKIPRITVQRSRRTCGGKYHELPFRKIEGCWANHE